MTFTATKRGNPSAMRAKGLNEATKRDIFISSPSKNINIILNKIDSASAGICLLAEALILACLFAVMIGGHL